MHKKVNWGILSTANIALKHVIPAMQKGKYSHIMAIASRGINKAAEASINHQIPKAYDSYDALLCDNEIDAVYIPLPHHMHTEWTIKCLEAGKHVLCEKPIALCAEDVVRIKTASEKYGKKVGEAFMVKSHPQWLAAKKMVSKGELGKLRSIHGFFSFYNTDPKNTRNIAAYGGGSLWDIGCYPITLSRYMFGEEPKRVVSLTEYDPKFNVDILSSAILDFPSGQATFTSSMQLAAFQRMQFFGTQRSMELEIPFNSQPDIPGKITFINGDIRLENTEDKLFAACNQYTLQGDAFSEAILNNTEVPVPITDSIYNTATIEAIIKSGKTGNWEKPIIPEF